MGFADQMERLGEELLEARQARGEFVDTVKEEADTALKSFTEDRKEMANQLRSSLADYNKRLKDETNTALEGFTSDREAMAEELRSSLADVVNRLKDETNATLKRFTNHRQEMADELRETFQGYREERRAFREELTKGGKAFRTAVTKRIPKEVAEVKEEAKEEVEEGEGTPYFEQVLEVIQSHLEGIRLADIGDQIGVAWQGLIPTVNRLLDEGKVRKEDQDYFPVE